MGTLLGNAYAFTLFLEGGVFLALAVGVRLGRGLNRR